MSELLAQCLALQHRLSTQGVAEPDPEKKHQIPPYIHTVGSG